MSTAARPLGANYRKLFASATAANLGDGLMSVALVWLASAVTRDAMLIALVVWPDAFRGWCSACRRA